MSPVLLCAGVALMAASAPLPVEKPKAGYAKKDGLSLTVVLDKKTYGTDDDLVLRFALKNETDKVIAESIRRRRKLGAPGQDLNCQNGIFGTDRASSARIAFSVDR